MKKKVFFGTLAAMIFSIHISAFAAPTAAFGDVSAGNHIAAPYAKSDIIVPRPSASKYAALQKYAYIGIPADVKGHWAEKYLTYFLQAGCMDGSAVAFHPNEPITYADFAAVVARLGLKPVEFNGGTVSHKVFRDVALWNTAYPDAHCGNLSFQQTAYGSVRHYIILAIGFYRCALDAYDMCRNNSFYSSRLCFHAITILAVYR